VQEGEQPTSFAPRPIASTGTRKDELKRRRALFVSVAVFLTVMFLGMLITMRKMGRGGSEVAASSYVLRAAPLRLQPNPSAGTSTTLNSGTVVLLTGMAVDSEGNRWYVLRRDDGRDSFLKVMDVAPPKVRLPDSGAQLLRAWLLVFRDPELIPDADSAVDYFCARFPSSSHCNELRMLAAAQFRSIAPRSDSSDTLDRARRMYQAVVDAKVATSAEAAEELKKLDRSGGTREGSGRATSRPKLQSSSANPGFGSASEYALVDRAEVHVRLPDLRALGKPQQIRVPIAREIRINGKVAVPSTATCTLKIAQSSPDKLEAQLTAIEFGNKNYPVRTRPQPISINGALVVFPLESPLLVGK
jgi:hypothetical protein